MFGIGLWELLILGFILGLPLLAGVVWLNITCEWIGQICAEKL